MHKSSWSMEEGLLSLLSARKRDRSNLKKGMSLSVAEQCNGEKLGLSIGGMLDRSSEPGFRSHLQAPARDVAAMSFFNPLRIPFLSYKMEIIKPVWAEMIKPEAASQSLTP